MSLSKGHSELSKESNFPKRRQLAQFVHVLGDRCAFVFEIVGDGTSQALMRDVMRRPGRAGKIAAQELVPALGAGFDARRAARDRKIDGLVIAGLEMQERNIGPCSPSCGRRASFRRRSSARRRSCARSVAPSTRRICSPIAAPMRLKNLTRQIGRVPFRVSGRGVAGEELVPAASVRSLPVSQSKVTPLVDDRRRAPCADSCAWPRRDRRGTRRSSRSRGSPSGTAGRCAAGSRGRRQAATSLSVMNVTCSEEALSRRPRTRPPRAAARPTASVVLAAAREGAVRSPA